MKLFILIIATISLSTCGNGNSKSDFSSMIGKEFKVKFIADFNVEKFDLTLTINNQNQINGFAGCNNYFGTYTLEKNLIKFSKIGATKKYCGGKDIITTEQKFLSTLENVHYFKMENDLTILFLNEKKTILLSLNQ